MLDAVTRKLQNNHGQRERPIVRRKAMGECPTKQMSSYQRLKWEMDNLIQEKKELQWMLETCKEALWKIANMKGPQVVETPRIALETLYKTDETNQKKN